MPNPPADRFLVWTLILNVVVHVAAIATMGLCLLPGLPGGPTVDVVDRAAYVAAHPWAWRLGWVPWHLCAVADVLTGIALVSTRWIPKLPALLTLAVTLCAVVPEQTGEITWVTQGVDLASRAGDNPTALVEYAGLEVWALRLTVEVGASLYIVMALGWTWCFAAAGTWSRTLSWLSVATWGTLSVASLGLLLPAPFRPGPLVAAVTNGVGFPLLVAWLWLVTVRVRARGR
jgi:hypothetical protein